MGMKLKKRNILFMLLGNLVLGLGVAIFKLSGLGNDPYTGMVMALGEQVHMEYANLLVILNVVLFVVEIAWGRKYIGLGTFFNAILQGYVVTFFYYVVCKIGSPEFFWQKLVTVIIGLLVGGSGLAMYQNAKAGAAPYDSLSMILSDRSHKSYFACRMLTDLICVIICFACGGIVNIGTVVSVFLMGPVADIVNRKFVSRVIQTEPEITAGTNAEEITE